MTKILFYLLVLAGFLHSTVARAQFPGKNVDFENSAPAPVLTNTQVSGWHIGHGLHVGLINNCYQVNCCNLTTSFSEVINTSGGYIDPEVGGIYPIYSVFGSGPSNPSANSLNPQLGFPLRGSTVLRLNSEFSGAGIESLTKTVSVTYTTNVLQIAFIIVVTGAHNCCESPGFNLNVSSSPCQYTFNTACPNANNTTQFYVVKTGVPTSNFANPIFSKWQVKTFDLSKFIGQDVVITLNASRCTLVGHYGYAYVDANLSPGTFSVNGLAVPGETITLPFCKTASVSAPGNYNTYQWLGPGGFNSTNSDFLTTVSGVYTLNVNASDPCAAATRTLLINILPPPAIYSSSAAICPGTTATLSSMGTASTYVWSHGGVKTSTLLVNPTITTVYTLSIIDTSGCSGMAVYTLSVMSSPELTVLPYPEFCAGDYIRIKVAGAHTYTWTSPNGFMYASDESFYKSDPFAGSVVLTVTATAVNGCTATSVFSVDTREFPVPVFKVEPPNGTCVGGTISLSGYGGAVYIWSGPFNLRLQGSEVTFKPEVSQYSGTYTLMVANVWGCKSYITKEIRVNDRPEGIIITDPKSACVPFFTVPFFIEHSANEAPIVKTVWKMNGKHFSRDTIHVKTPGKYLLEVLMTDSNTCSNTTELLVEGLPRPYADFSFEPLKPVEGLDEVLFTEATTGQDLDQFSWYIRLPEHTWTSTQKNPSYTFGQEGVYPVVLCISNSFGCRDTLIQTITVVPDFAIYVPNAFSPDDNDLNDTFFPVVRGVTYYNLKIFNRWGELLFQTTNVTEGWSGVYKGEDCPHGVYVWVIELSTNKGLSKRMTGNVLLSK
jgi:gliding motility-associated-like protein